MNSELADKNTILKQLNQELTDKNDLLKENLNTRGKNQATNSTYAEIVSNAKPKTKRVPKIVIRKTNKEETMKNMELSVTRCLIKEKTIQAKNIYKMNNEELIITCLKEESVDSGISLLKRSDLQNTCEVQKE